MILAESIFAAVFLLLVVNHLMAAIVGSAYKILSPWADKTEALLTSEAAV